MFLVQMPPNPLMTLSESFKSDIKSSILCEMQAEHLLSIPRLKQSVSTEKSLYQAIPASVDSANKGKTKR
jgi:hypothetical protein